jgi:hypothetical protein
MKQLIKVNLIFIVMLSVFCNTASGQRATFAEVSAKKAKGRITEYVSESGVVFKEGDTLKIGYPFRNDFFAHINSTTNIAMAAIGGGSVPQLTTTSSGNIGVIKKMRCTQRRLYVTTYGEGESMALSIVNFEEAFKTGEILLPNYINSDEALSALKKAKDKLDLGLITQEEYDKIKAELRKFI